MPPGADEVIKAAAQGGGWMAVVIVAVMLTAFLGLGALVRNQWQQHREDKAQAGERESRMAKRIDTLEDFQRNELKEVVVKNTLAVQSLESSLGKRPCLLPAKAVVAAQDALIEDIKG